MRKEALEQTLKRLKEGVLEILCSDKYMEYLQVMSRFHHYSVNNCILIAMQRPDATCVAGYSTWKSLGRHVKKGELGIRILAPCPVKTRKKTAGEDRKKHDEKISDDSETVIMYFKAATVFDYSQTEGNPLPSFGPDELTRECEQYEVLMPAIGAISSVPIRFDDIPGNAKGYFSRSNHEIVIQSGMSSAQTVKTALHELAHSILHAEKEKAKDRYQVETEAESVAFVICTHFGIDTSDYSFPYLAGWSSSAEGTEIMEALDTIRRTAGSVISDLEFEIQRLGEREAL